MEKILKELLSEMKEIKSTMATKGDVDALHAEIADVKSSLIRMENDMGEKISALFDSREVQTDVNERICDSLNRIEGKIDRLTLKVASHDAALKRVK